MDLSSPNELFERNFSIDPQIGIHPSFFCPISRELMKDPVATADGHSYERTQIVRWLKQHNTSPTTNAQLLHQQVVPNLALKSSIDEWATSLLDRIDLKHLMLMQAPPLKQERLLTKYDAIWTKGSMNIKKSFRIRYVSLLRAPKGNFVADCVSLAKLDGASHVARYLGIVSESVSHELLVLPTTRHGSLATISNWNAITDNVKHAMLFQIASGMGTLAAAGIVHRHLSLEVLLVKAFSVDDVTKINIQVSSYGFVGFKQRKTIRELCSNAPEVFLSGGKVFTDKSDVWAYGVVAWSIMSNGVQPFDGVARSVVDQIVVGKWVNSGASLLRHGRWRYFFPSL